MKKRIVACILFSFLFVVVLTPVTFAFPFDEYSKDNNNLKVTYNYNYDTDNDKTVVGQGLMFRREIEYTGLKDGLKEYSQKALLTISLPNGYFDDIEKSYKTDPDNYTFGCEESSTWFNEYVTNKVEYAISQNINEVGIYSAERGQTLEEAILKDIDYHYGDYKDGGAGIQHDATVEKDEGNIQKESDGYSITIYKKGPTVISSNPNRSEDYDIYDCVYENWIYVRYLTFSELPEIFIKVVYKKGVSKRILIADESNKTPADGFSNGDYTSYYQQALQKYDSYAEKNTGDQILNLKTLVKITWGEAVSGDKEAPGVDTGTTHNADENPGEDSGVSVPVAIVLGIVAAGAAIAGASGASNSNSSNASDEDKKKRAYKMYVQKDFGDSIKKGAKEPSIIRARMVEIDELGKEHERNDLTAKISVSGEDMVIQNVAMSGKYIEATVRVQKDTVGDKASITFTFTGEGGTFDNTVIFKLVDGPHIEFISVGEDEGTHNENCGINAILGDLFTYEACFMTVDVTTPPMVNDIKATNSSEFDVKFEETSEHLVYKMILKNNTKALDKKDVFAKLEEKRFEINVTIKDEEKPLKAFVAVRLYPEGITVDSSERGKKNEVEYIGIKSYEKEEVGELDSNWQPTTIKFTLAIKGKDKVIIDPKGTKYEFEKIKGAGGLGSKADIEQAIAEKYKYKERKDNNYEKFEYIFEPNTMLWDPEDGTFFMTLLPVTAEYQEYSYKEEIPLRICGKKVDEIEEWNREYEKVRNRIERFSVPGEKERNLKKLKEFAIADQYKASVLELRLMSKDILRSYMKYWTNEHEKDEYDMKVLEWQVFGLECAKWIGDCAFSFLVSAYAGPLADAIISPAKDFATGAIGELYSAWKYGEKIDINIIERFEFTKSLAAAGDNIVGNAIDITSWKKAAATLGGYFVYASIKAYIEKLNEGESDLYGAFVKGFSNMTLQAFKAAFANLFKKWMETSKYFQDTIAPKIQKYVTDTTISNFQLQYNNSQQLYGDLALKGAKEVEIKLTEVLSSLVSNLVGTGASYVVDKTLENVHTSSGFSIKNNHLIFTFTMQAFNSRTYEVTLDINSILMNVSCPLFGWLYDMIFGSVPVSSRTIDVPKDPPLPNKD